MGESLIARDGTDSGVAAKLEDAPSRLPPSDVLGLQRTVGNAAVARLLAVSKGRRLDAFRHVADFAAIQRKDERAAVATPTGSDAQLNAELDKLLANLRALPEPPAFEVIAAASVGQFSRGELTKAAVGLWRRKKIAFSEALRQVASKNLAGRNAPKPLHSPRGEGVTYARKAAVVLAPFNYKKSSNLSEYAHLVRKGSPFRKAVSSEYNPVWIIKDPTAVEMDAAIAKGVTDLFKLLKSGELGELMVNFQGHGGGGAIAGVDEGYLTRKQLAAHGEVARIHGIKLLFVLDTCQSGPLAMSAREEIGARAAERLPGGPKHPLIAAYNSYLQARLKVAQGAYGVVFAARVGLNHKIFKGLSRREALSRRTLLRFQRLMALSTACGEFPRALAALDRAISGVNAAALTPVAQAAGLAALAGASALDSKRALMSVAASMEDLLDGSNDLANRAARAVTEAAREQRPASEASTPHN